MTFSFLLLDLGDSAHHFHVQRGRCRNARPSTLLWLNHHFKLFVGLLLDEDLALEESQHDGLGSALGLNGKEIVGFAEF